MSRSELARRRARLMFRIRRRFEVITETVALGPMRLDFLRVADPDVVLDQIVEEEDRREKLSGESRHGNELHLPYWAELWDSAVGMGWFLVDRRSDFAHQELATLDLGCGMGFAGIVAAAFGQRVLLADLERDALLFAQYNALPYSSRVRTRALDWQVAQLNERFDLILGADVLYDRTQWAHLEPFWRRHLASNGTVLLGEPGRQTGDQFVNWIEARGWSLDRVDVPATARSKPIRLFLIGDNAARCAHKKIRTIRRCRVRAV